MMQMAREPRSHLTLVTRTTLRRNRQCGCVRQSEWTPPLELSKLQAVSVKQAKATADDRQKLARHVRRSQKQAAKRIFDEKAGRIKKRHPRASEKASEKNRLTWLAKLEKLFARERTVAEAAAELVAAEVAVMTPATSGDWAVCVGPPATVLLWCKTSCD